MSMENIEVNVNLKEYFDKMSPEDAVTITAMCMDKLCSKAQELQDLYVQLVKTYGFEMGAIDLTLLVQVSSPALSAIPVCSLFGTNNGIKHALAVMINANMEKEKEEKNG